MAFGNKREGPADYESDLLLRRSLHFPLSKYELSNRMKSEQVKRFPSRQERGGAARGTVICLP